MIENLGVLSPFLKVILRHKVEDLVVLYLGELTTFADFFVIVSGESTVQTKALARELREELKKVGIIPYGVEGEKEGLWILMDYGSVIIHIFQSEKREFYDLEGMWYEAERVPLEVLLGDVTKDNKG